MTHVDVTVPESLLAALRKAPHEMADELRPCGGDSLVSAERNLDGARR